MRKKIIPLFFIFILLVSFVGCLEMERIAEDKTTPRLDLREGTELNFTHDVEGVEITTFYNTNGYNLSEWLITDSKMISFGIKTDQETEKTILMEHTHIDIRIKATDPQLNGLTQDYMDDSYHGQNQDGFLIDKNYSYNEVFSIDGFSKDLIDGWMFYSGSYGHGEITSKRLTEKNLRNQGVYGNELVVVYNLLVKNPDEEYFHTVTITDKVIIPLKPIEIAPSAIEQEPTEDKKANPHGAD